MIEMYLNYFIEPCWDIAEKDHHISIFIMVKYIQ
jgi:hypothetical protein